MEQLNLPQDFIARNTRVVRRQRILIADDEKVIADTLRVILTHEGFDAIAVYGGEPAVQAARQWRPDLFLGDVVMPDLNGVEAAIRLTSAVPECDVLLLSGQVQALDLLEEGRQQGYDFELILKPIHPSVLLQRVRLRLGRSPGLFAEQ